MLFSLSKSDCTIIRNDREKPEAETMAYCASSRVAIGKILIQKPNNYTGHDLRIQSETSQSQILMLTTKPMAIFLVHNIK